MNLQPSPRQREIAALVEEFAAQHCSDRQEYERDRDGAFPEAMYRELATRGLLSVWPGTAKGTGFLDGCTLSEHLARYSGTAASLAFVNGVCGALVARSAHQRAPELCNEIESGTTKLALAMTEKSAGSDPAGLATTVTRDGENFVVNGEKLYTTGALEADFILVVARSADDPQQPGVSIIAIERGADGLDVQPLDKIGGNAHASCTVRLHDVSVPVSQLIGPENGAGKLLFLGSLVERLAIAASAVGTAQHALNEVLTYLQQRTSAGRAVTSYQSIRHQLADLATQVSAMRQLAYFAAWKAEAGTDAVADINMAKIFCVETGHRVVTEALRLAGGAGYLQDSVLYRLWREATLGFYAGGTGEIARNKIAASLGF